MTEDGRKVLSANYFVIAVLDAARAKEKNETPSEINNEEARAELDRLYVMLGTYGINLEEARDEISCATRTPSYKSTMDEVVFSKMTYTAEAKAKKKDSGTVDASIYLELIFAEPTAAIKNFITAKTEKPDPQLDAIGRMLSKFSESAEKPEPEPEKNPTVTEIVDSTRKIREFLLESVYGQDQAVNTFVAGYFQAQLMACSRKGAKKPPATFLFAGPPGVGKTFLAEKVAEALALPYKRFDMSEYSDYEAAIEFCGADQVYKNSKGGNVTDFVSKNPKCVLLFDEIEKSHINIIHLFLQILDAGHVSDKNTDTMVSFADAVLIFTTNVGRNLYDDPSVTNLSAIPRKKVLKALATDVDPITRAPRFPAPICSRFASGNVVMFNHLEASNLYRIAKKELDGNVKGFEASTGIKIQIDDEVPSAIMFAEGGKADARTVRGRANAFFHEEIYELLRLLSSSKGVEAVDSLKEIRISVPLDGLSPDVSAMFKNPKSSGVLVFADGSVAEECKKNIGDKVDCYFANTVAKANDILFRQDISVILCDVRCGMKDSSSRVLNAEDLVSAGHDFLSYAIAKYSQPVYVLEEREGDITREEFLSFAKLGVRDVLAITSDSDSLGDRVADRCRIAHQQANMMKLARENKTLSYKTSQTVSEDNSRAVISLFGFKLSLLTDVEDSTSVLDDVSRPNLRFDDVIGAEDAKQELKYFVEYLKNPIEYMRKGVRSPKGVLLYGPPGTGKTLLAKAMAGESGVTFLRAEGNEFLKRYVGEGAEAVHALFNSARKYAPAIVFVDEIDAIGKDRNLTGPSDVTSDVLTAFLTEMDGFNTDTTKPVFVLAATNYGVDPDSGKSLDAALLRRFDRRIYIDLPNKEERKRYLEMKLSKNSTVKLSADQLDSIATRSAGMSLAELESVFEMALRCAIRSKTGVIGDAEFEEAFETFNGGEKRENSTDILTRVARHEAGHALICWMCGEKPAYLTIVARGDHGGYMQHASNEDKGIYTRREIMHKIRTSLGGRAAELVYYGAEDGVSTGASGDLYSATRLAKSMMCRYGMDESVGLSYIDPTESSSTADLVRERVNAILKEELDAAVKTIDENRAAIDAMVDALMDKNHLKETEIDGIFSKTVKTK